MARRESACVAAALPATACATQCEVAVPLVRRGHDRQPSPVARKAAARTGHHVPARPAPRRTPRFQRRVLGEQALAAKHTERLPPWRRCTVTPRASRTSWWRSVGRPPTSTLPLHDAPVPNSREMREKLSHAHLTELLTDPLTRNPAQPYGRPHPFVAPAPSTDRDHRSGLSSDVNSPLERRDAIRCTAKASAIFSIGLKL